ncbi:OLC1v1030028C1 [Oldenlandia corymbosa var. corymbosa]|uniref:OLC1v1030028C1 n=1 Tax=Oldenlandia corymbosa var. corymbosa TaxID=529605 RepID=A0AAV1CG50_OLDCO|nr:OLC1v1030028C1 [Oldenlandia corymbosa var. corymbosa]
MASSFLQGALLQKSTFLGHPNTNLLPSSTHKNGSSSSPKQIHIVSMAKFNPLEILGGRGLCNGEAGLQEELKKSVTPLETAPADNVKNPETEEESQVSSSSTSLSVPEEGFEKELQGLTGGFPGGEKGLQKFLKENPPPPKKTKAQAATAVGFNQSLVKKPKPPEFPILLPGMIVIVKNPNSPYYMYCGNIQRITDGKAGVLFEGGVWDRLITFRLEELERREKGPPMVNPRSAVLEKILEKRASSSSESS